MITEQQLQRADRDRLVMALRLVIADLVLDNPEILTLPPGDSQHRLVIDAALGYLIGHGLITVLPEQSWPFALPRHIPEHLAPDIDAVLRRGLRG